MNKKIKVAIYIRVSTHHQIDKDSLPMQRKDLVSYTKLILNTDNYEIFEDAGYSGKNIFRPGLQNMLTKIRAKEFTHVLVWKIDRISRNLLDFANMYKELKDYGVTFVSKNEQFDTSTAIGEAMLKIILVFAELERNMTVERVTATMISRASNGLWNGGRVPFGYNYDYKTKHFSVNNQEAKVVILIHDLYEKLGSLVQMAKYLNDKGFRTRAELEWSPTSLSIILKSVFYCGDYQYNVRKSGCRQKQKDPSDWVIIKNHHPSIISKNQKQRVLNKLNQNLRVTKNKLYTTKGNIHIFKGIIRCGICGFLYTSTSYYHKKDRYQYSRYFCPSSRHSTIRCNNISITDSTIGEFVFNYISNILNSKNEAKNISSFMSLQKILLKGNTFSYIKKINENDLKELFLLITKNSKTKNVLTELITTSKLSLHKKINSLQKKREKQIRALERLTQLYLYTDKSMSESDFVKQKEKILSSIKELDIELNSEQIDNKISDKDFIRQAGNFIVTKNLSGKHFISYNRLALSIDKKIIKNFISSLIDQITVKNGKIKSITFKNGLSQTFDF